MKPTHRISLHRKTPLAALLALPLSALVLSGCAITPKPVTHDEVAKRVQDDRAAMYKDQEPVTVPITLSEAMARALKYNFDYRLKLMEGALSQGLLDVSEKDMLPKLVTSAGYQTRSNDSGGTSIGIEDRLVSLRPSTSEERSHFLGQATLSWNALDFGLSYYRAKQAADNVNIADERRRKVLQTIVQDVRDAYWRALGAQQLEGQAQTLAANIQSALEKSREAERAGVLPPAEGLAYQRALLDSLTLVNQKLQEMEFAKRELAALMSLPPGTKYTLAATAETPLPAVPADLDQLEVMALENRPELREEDYQARIDANETRKQIAALFPSLNLFGGVSYDSNKYLYNSGWAQGGVGISFDLLRLAAYPAIKRTNEARLKADDARRMALSMAVLTQVRVSVERYRLAAFDHNLAQESAQVDQRLASISLAASSNQIQSELETLRTDARALVSQFQESSSYAATQSAYGRILNSVGIDLLPTEVSGTDVPTLSQAIDQSLIAKERGVFPQATAAAQASHPLSVQVASLPAGVAPAVVQSAVENVISRNHLTLGQSPDGLKLGLEFSSTAQTAARRALWRFTLTDVSGKTLFTKTYASFLPNEVSTRSVSALAEAATLSMMSDVRRFAQDEQTVSAAK